MSITINHILLFIANILTMSDRNLKKSNIYVYELPYTERKEFCNIIDLNDKWEELGKYFCIDSKH